MLSKDEGGIQFIELRSSNIIWSPEKHSEQTKRGGNAFVHFFMFFYLVIKLRRRETAAYLEVLQDVGRVGHAQPQHGSLGDLLHQPPQQSG